MPTAVRNTKPQHQVIADYKEKQPKTTKADIEKKLLKKFGIETFSFFGKSISVKTQLVYPEKRVILLNYLEKLNILLNNENNIDLDKLLEETQSVLKEVFSDPSFNKEDFLEMAKDLHYLMSHQSETHGNNFPYHALNLRSALIKDLSSKKVYKKAINNNNYTGNLLNDKPNGQGTMNYDNGFVYVGNFVDGLRMGTGTMTFGSTTTTYEGSWLNDLPHGKGVECCESGEIYRGFFLNGERNGYGILTYPNGEKYEGDWLDGYSNGKGELRYDGNTICSHEWKRGCLPANKTPPSNLKELSSKARTDNMISQARTEFVELIAQEYPKQNNIPIIPAQVYPRLQGSKFAYIAAIDPIFFKHDRKKGRIYGPEMFSVSTKASIPNIPYLVNFFDCATQLASISANQLTLPTLKNALSNSHYLDNIELNFSGIGNPKFPATLYYNFDNNDDGIKHFLECGLFHSQDNVMPNSQCIYYTFYKMVPFFKNEDIMHKTFDEYKNYFLDKVREANENKNGIKAAIILFISQIEGTHFFTDGNNRLSCQLLLNKLLVEYGVYDDNLGSILFIPNGFSHYALSHLNYYLQENRKTLEQCTIQDLENALISAIAWVDFGHECYQKVATPE